MPFDGAWTRSNSTAQFWITQAGFSTWRGDERAQVRAFVDALDAPVERMYWQAAHDRNPRRRYRFLPLR